MAEKRFTTVELPKPNRYGIWYDGAYLSTYQVCILLNDYVDVKKMNEELKKDVDYWKQVASQYSNELNVFEHCKKYKTECKDIHWSSV